MKKKDVSNEVTKNPLTKSISLKILRFIVGTMWYLGWLATLIVVGITVIVIAGINPDNLHMDMPVRIDFVEGGDDHEWIENNDRPAITHVEGMAQVNVKPLGLGKGILVMNFLVLSVLLYMWAVFQLRRVIKTLVRGDPFNESNPKRLRLIGFITLAAGPVLGGFQLVQGLMFLGKLDVPGADVGLHFDGRPELIFTGLVILVIAQVFDLAAKMKREQDLTI